MTEHNSPQSENELIAEFMEMRHRKNYGIMGDTEWTEVKVTYNSSMAEWQIAKWDKSWDWLMPVVEKIKTLYVNSNHNWDWLMAIYELRHPILSATIADVYKSVVQFIKWYNNQQPK